MHPQLTYSTEDYREKLSEYAKDTVEYYSTNRFLKYKVNKNDNDAVVEKINGQFKIYVNTKPTISIVVTGFRDADYRTMFFAIVNTDEHVGIKVYWAKGQKVIHAIFAVFMLAICIASGSLPFTIMISLFSIGYLLYIRRAKKRYKTFIITFLNTIAA